jgi:signal recognition particle GTPase
MNIQTWITGQLVIEIILIALILWVVKSNLKIRKKNEDLNSVFEKPEQILEEMRELTSQLDKNLEEKKELSRRMLGQLEEILVRADKSYKQMETIMKDYSSKPVHAHHPGHDSNRMNASVNDLLEQGLSKEKIAQQLGISVSEIELLQKMQNRQIRSTGNNV